MQSLSQPIVEYGRSIGEFLYFDAALLTEPSMVLRLLLLGALLFCSAFFSSSETALFSLSRLDLQQLRRQRNPHSDVLHALLDQHHRDGAARFAVWRDDAEDHCGLKSGSIQYNDRSGTDEPMGPPNCTLARGD